MVNKYGDIFSGIEKSYCDRISSMKMSDSMSDTASYYTPPEKYPTDVLNKLPLDIRQKKLLNHMYETLVEKLKSLPTLREIRVSEKDLIGKISEDSDIVYEPIFMALKIPFASEPNTFSKDFFNHYYRMSLEHWGGGKCTVVVDSYYDFDDDD